MDNELQDVARQAFQFEIMCTVSNPAVSTFMMAAVLLPNTMKVVSVRIAEMAMTTSNMNDGNSYDILRDIIGGVERIDGNYNECWRTMMLRILSQDTVDLPAASIILLAAGDNNAKTN